MRLNYSGTIEPVFKHIPVNFHFQFIFFQPQVAPNIFVWFPLVSSIFHGFLFQILVHLKAAINWN